MTPRLADRHALFPQLRDAALYLLGERERRYPALVEAGRLTAAEAARRLELARCLVAQWQWVADPAAPPLPAWADPGHFDACVVALAAEIAGAADAARRQAAADPTDERRAIADWYEALAWWQRVTGMGLALVVDRVDLGRRLTTQLRAAARRPDQREAA